MPQSRKITTPNNLTRREWVRSFDIGHARKIGNYMVYDVTSVLFPAGFPEAGTRLTTVKRFSEFQKLYHSLLQIHQKLHLKGDPPPKLPKTSYFNRFDLQVLEDRRLVCLQLLNHAGRNPILYSSQVFVSFLSNISPNDQATLSPSIGSDDEVDEIRGANLVDDLLKNDENKIMIQDLKDKGDIMDATALATHLIGPETGMVCPLVPEPTAEDEILRENSNSTTENLSSQSNLLTIEVRSDFSSPDGKLPAYLSDAADSIGRAIQYESEENWNEAVSSYRNAIGTLLSSVQKDPCLKRQASVKRRISAYIEKAESLMQMDNIKEEYNKSTGKEDKSRQIRSRIPHLDLFGKTMQELRRYKIRKILSSQVLLAIQQNFPSSLDTRKPRGKHGVESKGDEVVIKTLQKNACVYRLEDDQLAKTSILPVNVSYMTKLLRYYENDDFLHLVIEYIPGGELYKAVEPYFKQNFVQNARFLEYGNDQTNLVSDKNENVGNSGRLHETFMEPSEQPSQKACPSPYGAKSISVIKPSPSFISTRKKSIVKQLFATLKPKGVTRDSGFNPSPSSSGATFYLDRSSESREGSVSPSGSMSSIDYVCTYTDVCPDDTKDQIGAIDKLICINSQGIETIDCDNRASKTDHADESFDFVDDLADETGHDVAKTITLEKTRLSSSVEENLDFSSFDLEGAEEEDLISATYRYSKGENNPPEITMTLAGKMYSEPVKLVKDSKFLLESVSSKLVERQSEKETAEKILSHLEEVESKIETQFYKEKSSPNKCSSATGYQHTPAKVHPSLLLAPAGTSFHKKQNDRSNTSVSPLSPSTLATTPTSVISSPPDFSHSSSETESPCSNDSEEHDMLSLRLWDIVPYYNEVNLRTTNHIPIGLIRKWSAQISKALFSLHSRGIIIQDLRPCNLLIDLKGNIKLTYQCNWISIDKRVSIERLLDEQEGVYCAPELGRMDSVSPAVDWWSLGVILYELYVGERFAVLYPSRLLPHTPVQFDESDLLATRRKSYENNTVDERRCEEYLRSLITGFLKPLPEDRLQDAEDITQHPFFKGVNWENLKQLV